MTDPTTNPSGPTDKRDKVLKDIATARDKARTDIHVGKDKLQARIEFIERPNPPRALTANEVAELGEIDDAMQALIKADEDIALDDLLELSQSAEVQDLINTLNATNAELKAKLKDVQRVAKQLKNLAALFKNIDGVVQGLVRLAAVFV